MVDKSVFAAAQTAVFWDMEDCPIPDGLNLSAISQNIRSALIDMGYIGPISSITAYVDDETSPFHVDDFDSAGIKLVRVVEGWRGRAMSRLNYLTDGMLFWPCNNLEPSNLLAITDFVPHTAIESLVSLKCNVLLALPEHAKGRQLIDGASSVWFWASLSVGGKPIEKIATCPCCRAFKGEASTVVEADHEDHTDCQG